MAPHSKGQTTRFSIIVKIIINTRLAPSKFSVCSLEKAAKKFLIKIVSRYGGDIGEFPGVWKLRNRLAELTLLKSWKAPKSGFRLAKLTLLRKLQSQNFWLCKVNIVEKSGTSGFRLQSWHCWKVEKPRNPGFRLQSWHCWRVEKWRNPDFPSTHWKTQPK